MNNDENQNHTFNFYWKPVEKNRETEIPPERNPLGICCQRIRDMIHNCINYPICITLIPGILISFMASVHAWRAIMNDEEINEIFIMNSFKIAATYFSITVLIKALQIIENKYPDIFKHPR